MIHVTVTTVPHLLSDGQVDGLGMFLRAIVATALDVPHDERAAVRNADVSVEVRSYISGSNMRAISIFILAPDHPHRQKNLVDRLETIATALRTCPHLPSRSITDQKGGVEVQIMLGPSAAAHI